MKFKKSLRRLEKRPIPIRRSARSVTLPIRTGRVSFLVVALVASVSLAACGTDNSKSDGSSSKAPIKLAQVALIDAPIASLPFVQSSVEAAVKAVNAAGGVGGRQLEISSCNEKNDPNQAVTCVQRAVQDKNTVALVGGVTNYAAQFNPILEAAKMPNIGADAITPGDVVSPTSFLLDAGIPGTLSAMPAAAKEYLGATKVATVHADNNPSASDQLKFFEAGADAAHVSIVKNVTVAADAVDFSPYVAQAESAGAQALVTILSPSVTLGVWKSLTGDLHTLGSDSSTTPDIVKQAGAGAEGNYVLSGVPAANEDNEWGKAYIAEMKKYAPDEKTYTALGLRAWASVHLFADVASMVDGNITRESVMNEFSKLHDFDFMWVKSLSYDEDGPLSSYPRIVPAITTVFTSHIKDGQYVSDGTFDPFGS